MRGYFVAGTDTGVGKTEVARALCAMMRSKGLSPRPLKPVETGCEPDKPEDALALRAAAGSSLTLDEICPYRLRMPAAPLVAAEAEGVEIDLLRIEALAATGTMVVEAAGGLLVPLARAPLSLDQLDPPDRSPSRAVLTNLDLAVRLALPVVLVGHAGLGTLNHCALSALAIEDAGLTLAAIVVNRVVRKDDPTVASNAKWVGEMTGARVLGPTRFVASPAGRPAALAQVLAPLVP